MINIKAVAINKSIKSDWIDLPDTTEWLNSKQIIPQLEDQVGIVGNDIHIPGVKWVMRVTNRLIRHSTADIVIELEYREVQ